MIREGQHLLVAPNDGAGLLLRRLALSSAVGVSREELLGLLWPEADEQAALKNFNTLVHQVRKLLRADCVGASSPIVNRDGNISLNPACGISVDVDHFDALVDRAEQAEADHRSALALERYEAAIEVYHGDLSIEGKLQDDLRAVVERERLCGRYQTVLARAAELAGQSHHLTQAMAYSLKLLATDPCSEVGHRLLMHVHMLRGERSQALHQYRVCVEMLRREYDAGPEAATDAMFEMIRLGTWTTLGGCALIRG